MEKTMSQLQQLPLRQTQTGRESKYRLGEQRGQYEADLLSQIFSRNGREDLVETATPPGYSYRQNAFVSPAALESGSPVMQIAAHPGDGPDFFYATYLQMTYRPAYHEVVLTAGERGVNGWSSERTRQVRRAEARAGAEIVGGTLHFLDYADGSLPFLADNTRKKLIVTLAALLEEIQPGLVVVHSPRNDHPDHAYSFLLTLAALHIYAQSGRSLPTLLVHDVEFGLRQENLWISPALHFYAPEYPMHVPGLLVDISSTHELAQQALHMHRTQMCDPVGGRPKAYADLIDVLARVRGLQLMTGDMAQLPRGQGFQHVIVPGMTNEQNILPLLVPAGNVYECYPEKAI